MSIESHRVGMDGRRAAGFGRRAAWRAAALLAALLLAGGAAGYDLQIITPHNENIQAEFERAFVAWLQRPVKLRWIKKGTGQIIQQLDAQERGSPGGSFDLDVFFGGGVPDHDLAASKGFLEAATLPAEVLEQIPATIAGVANFGAGNLWIASAQSSFGILMNTRALRNQGLPEPQRWSDLADPKMYSWVVLADPRKSASVRVAYELILQEHGWERGWAVLMKIAANARTIAESSSSIPNEIASGNVLVGPCIDFYAFARVATAPADLKYINPVGGSAITPDPISLLRRAPNRELAERFIEFVLRPEGQRLWILPAGHPDGPREHALFRLPVRPDVCRQYAAAMGVVDPYQAAEAGTFRHVDDELQRSRNVLLAELIGAVLVDLHRELKETWKALIDGGLKPDALARFEQPPFAADQAPELNRALEAGGRNARRLAREWNEQFRARYQEVRRAAR